MQRMRLDCDQIVRRRSPLPAAIVSDDPHNVSGFRNPIAERVERW